MEVFKGYIVSMHLNGTSAWVVKQITAGEQTPNAGDTPCNLNDNPHALSSLSIGGIPAEWGLRRGGDRCDKLWRHAEEL